MVLEGNVRIKRYKEQPKVRRDDELLEAELKEQMRIDRLMSERPHAKELSDKELEDLLEKGVL